MAETSAVNPWTWQDALSFAQGVQARGVDRVLFCAGQASLDANGNVLHAGDMAAQLSQALDNLESVLAKAGFTLANVVRLSYYVTDMEAFRAASGVIGERLEALAIKPAGVLLGVATLFDPDLMVEIEATAVA